MWHLIVSVGIFWGGFDGDGIYMRGLYLGGNFKEKIQCERRIPKIHYKHQQEPLPGDYREYKCAWVSKGEMKILEKYLVRNPLEQAKND